MLHTHEVNVGECWMTLRLLKPSFLPRRLLRPRIVYDVFLIQQLIHHCRPGAKLTLFLKGILPSAMPSDLFYEFLNGKWPL